MGSEATRLPQINSVYVSIFMVSWLHYEGIVFSGSCVVLVVL